jgi:pimeloyl-ACP methyl ester carboxylesterase
VTPLPARACVDGVELHWSESGTGPPVVILHGLADSQHTWGAVAARLAQRFRVLCLDLPGCGLSGRPDAPYTLDWQARLVNSWLDHLGIRNVDVVGHSYGGGVALWLLLYRARSIRKLALIAPGGLGIEVGPWLRLAAFFGRFEAGAELLIGPITALLTRVYGCELGLAERQALYRMNAVAGTGRAFSRTLRGVVDWRGQTRQLLQRVNDVPQLPAMALFWGELDRVLPIQHGESLVASLENCSLWRLAGAGHFLHWQAPEALARAILEYLDDRVLATPRFRMTSEPARSAFSHTCEPAATEAQARTALRGTPDGGTDEP